MLNVVFWQAYEASMYLCHFLSW